jgi:hypothetical protein
MTLTNRTATQSDESSIERKIHQIDETQLVEEQRKLEMNLEVKLEINDYISSFSLTKKESKEILKSINKSNSPSNQYNEARVILIKGITQLIGLSFCLTLPLVAFALSKSDADLILIKDLVLQLLVPQIALLSLMASFYWKTKKD